MTKNIFDLAEEESKKHVEAILKSDSKKKIVVAGPGTGKTYLFKKILEGKRNSLTLTFVNSLVEDLSLELYGLSEVKTLHGFARGVLGSNVKVYPKLSEIIREDAKLILEKDVDFDDIFHNVKNEDKFIEFYKSRRKSYDNYYGFSDIIYGAVKYLELNKDKISSYEQILVDEFQDFNLLEILLIDLLAEKSPILLAGDDDQALYDDLKSASTDHIRKRYDVSDKDYEKFTLPHCRRCTRVMVDAVSDILSHAVKNGFLKQRIPKKYKYFEHKEKNLESEANSKIIYSQQFVRKIPWFIEQQLGKIADEVKGKFSVLIIAPTNLHLGLIVSSLKDKGFENIALNERNGNEAMLLDGLTILLDSPQSNLGWRIISKFILEKDYFEELIKETYKKDSKSIYEMMTKEHKKEINKIIHRLRIIREKKKIGKDDLHEVFNYINIDPFRLARESLQKKLISHKKVNPALKNIPIKPTTVQSSKGLSSDYVFITNFDDSFFIRDRDKTKITDKDIRNFLVALTRAKKRVYLISSVASDPTFLKWIEKNRIKVI